MRVGDGGGADLEVALGLLELTSDRDQLRLREHDRVLREQDVEIGLRDTQDQILGRLRERRVGLHHLRL